MADNSQNDNDAVTALNDSKASSDAPAKSDDDSETTIVAPGALLPEIPGFHFISPLGEGGMASVFLAEDLRLKKRFAVKLMSAELNQKEEFRTRFEDECAILANLEHPNIVRVYSAREHQDQLFMVMEYVPGPTLKQRLDKHIKLDAMEAASITGQLADALCYTHAHDAIHRDMKPANIIFKPNGQAMLADFGIAKSSQYQSTHTQTGMSLLTVRYASPEQFRGEQVDGKTDVYSLGLMFYEMLTGDIPSEALRVIRNDADTKLLKTQLPKPYRLYAPLIASCLRLNAGERPTAAEIARKLKTQAFGGDKSDKRLLWTTRRGMALVLMAGILITFGVWVVNSSKLKTATFDLNPADTTLYHEGKVLSSKVFEYGSERTLIAAVADGYIGDVVVVGSSFTGNAIEISLVPLTNPGEEDFQKFDDRFFPSSPIIDLKHDDITYPPFKFLLAWKIAVRAGESTQDYRDQVLLLSRLGDTSAQLTLFLASIGELIEVDSTEAESALKLASNAKLGLATYYLGSMYHLANQGKMGPQENSIYLEIMQRAANEGASYDKPGS